MKILLSNLHLKEFGGSELVTVELAEYYASIGHKVTIYSPLIGAPLLPTIKRDNITLVIAEPALEELYSFDVIWSHHGLLLETINSKNKLAHQLIVSNHMSSWLSVEEPKYGFDQVDIILANSEETRAKMSELHRAKCQLFQNPCAAPQWSEKTNCRNKPLGLSISNHRPAELITFMGSNSHLIDFELLGCKTQNYLRLSAQKIYEIEPDFVICNGKSVQYALAANVPVFLYDSFGGSGWLTEDNFADAEWHNFSGRGIKGSANLADILLFDTIEPIEMTNERKNKFILENRIKQLGIY
jgi:hypothetical protein